MCCALTRHKAWPPFYGTVDQMIMKQNDESKDMNVVLEKISKTLLRHGRMIELYIVPLGNIVLLNSHALQ